MRKKKGGWTKGVLILIYAIGFLLAGIFVSNYFQAKASGEPTNQLKNSDINLVHAKNPEPQTVVRNNKSGQDEHGWIFKEHSKGKKQEQVDSVGITNQKNEMTSLWNKKEDQGSDTFKPENNKNDSPQTNKEEASGGQQGSEKNGAQQQPEKDNPQSQPGKNNGQSNGNNKTVYLTFDDGPESFSDKIINLLEKYHYKATFFMIDGNIRRYPESVKLMVSHDEAVGLHSVSHSVKKFYASAASVLAELTQNRNTLKEISGIDSHLMRTPYGSVPKMTPAYRKAVDEQGYLMWDWNIDSKDWYYKDARYVNSVIEQLNRLKNHNGPIVILLHERKETLAHLPALLEYLSKHGYQGKAIDSTITPFQFLAR